MLISEEFPPFMFGGVASFCHDLAYNLAKRGVATTVACGRSPNRNVFIERPHENLRIVRLPVLDVPPRFLWFQKQNVGLLRKLIRDHSLVHVVNPQAGAMPAYLSRRMRVPVVTSIHEVPLYRLRACAGLALRYWSFGDFANLFLGYPLNHGLTATCLRYSDRIVACAKTLAGEMREAYGRLCEDRISIVGNGIDIDRINRILRNAVNSPKDRGRYVVFYGRLNLEKGLMYLIEAFADSTDIRREMKLRIFGKGPLETKLRKQISKLGLSDQITLCGHVSYERLISEIKGAVAVVLPSMYEAQPIAILEAMALGKPVLAFDYPYARELIVHEKNGILARACSPRDLAEKMRTLICDGALRERIGGQARMDVISGHNWDRIAEEYLHVYDELQNSVAWHSVAHQYDARDRELPYVLYNAPC